MVDWLFFWADISRNSVLGEIGDSKGDTAEELGSLADPGEPVFVQNPPCKKSKERHPSSQYGWELRHTGLFWRNSPAFE